MLRKNLAWIVLVGLPVVFLVSAAHEQSHEAWLELIGRLGFLFGMAALAVFTYRVLSPTRGAIEEYLAANRTGLLYGWRYVWFSIGLIAPIVLGLIAALGYYYTSLRLSTRLQATVWLILGLLIIREAVLRWAYIARKRLSKKQYQDRIEAKGEAREGQAGGRAEGVALAERDLDMGRLNAQIRRLLNSSLALALIVGTWAIWVDVLPALGVLNHKKLWDHKVKITTITEAGGSEVTMRELPVTVADVGLAIVVLIMAFIASRNLPGLMEISVLQRLKFDSGVRYAITTISRYLITIIAIVIAFGMIRIGWSDVQWLAAAVTVGLGFGLQEIFANFVSGLIILFERPVRVGDTITVKGITGTVTRIRIRATTIIDWDHKELIVPNKEFITGQLINWTLTDSVLRLQVPVLVMYGVDSREVERILIKTARENPQVLNQPGPSVAFNHFAPTGMEFILKVYVANLDDYYQAQHDLHVAIEQAFREGGIDFVGPKRASPGSPVSSAPSVPSVSDAHAAS